MGWSIPVGYELFGSCWEARARRGAAQRDSGVNPQMYYVVVHDDDFPHPTHRKSIRPTLEMFFSIFFFQQRHEERAPKTFGPTIFQRLPSFDEKAMDPRFSIYGRALWHFEKK